MLDTHDEQKERATIRTNLEYQRLHQSTRIDSETGPVEEPLPFRNNLNFFIKRIRHIVHIMFLILRGIFYNGILKYEPKFRKCLLCAPAATAQYISWE